MARRVRRQPAHKSGHLISTKNFRRGLIGLFVVLAALYMLNSPMLKFGYVKVTGNSYMPREEILQIARISEPINIFSVQTDAVQKNLQSDLRIESAKVWRDLPNCLNIEIVEREPLAVIACNYGYVDVDKKGVIINTYSDAGKIKKPLISGLVLQDVYTGDSVDNATVKNLLAYLGDLTPETAAQISYIDMNDPQHVQLYTAKGTWILLGTVSAPQDLAAKTNDFMNDIRAAAIPIDYIDFSYSRPVLRVKQ